MAARDGRSSSRRTAGGGAGGRSRGRGRRGGESSSYPTSAYGAAGATDKKPCCCGYCCCLIVTMLSVVAGGFVLWRYLPANTKNQVRNVLPGGSGCNSFRGGDGCNSNGGGGGDSNNNSTSGGGDGDGDWSGITGLPSFGNDGEPPRQDFAFDSLCDDAAACCNGLSNLCDARLNEIMYAGLHNGAASVENGFYLAGNHDYSLEDALEAGFRAINLDLGICADSGDLRLMHGSCRWGSRDPVEVFANVAAFLNANPREVVLMPAELVTVDGVTPTLDQVYQAMLESAAHLADGDGPGIAEHMYWHDPSQDWPTLEQLIQIDKRLVFFYYNAPSCDELENDPDAPELCPPAFQHWFRYATETPFEFDSVDAVVSQSSTSCQLERGRLGPLDFFAVNMFVTNPLPSRTASETLNAKETLESHVGACSRQVGLGVNVLFVDFWSVGDTVEFVQTYNSQIAATAAVVEDEDVGGNERRRTLRRSNKNWR